MIAPRRVWAAWAHGRTSCNLYHRSYDDQLLDMTVAAARAELGLTPPR